MPIRITQCSCMRAHTHVHARVYAWRTHAKHACSMSTPGMCTARTHSPRMAHALLWHAQVGADRAACAVIALDSPGSNYRAVWAMTKHYPHVKVGGLFCLVIKMGSGMHALCGP